VPVPFLLRTVTVRVTKPVSAPGYGYVEKEIKTQFLKETVDVTFYDDTGLVTVTLRRGPAVS
jgi:hypothetical protein